MELAWGPASLAVSFCLNCLWPQLAPSPEEGQYLLLDSCLPAPTPSPDSAGLEEDESV